MGDRGNIVVRTAAGQGNDVWFYTHWSGSNILETVQTALKRKQRWEDPAYLARIIFCELVKGQEANETGFGISTGVCDNEHDFVLVDVPAQMVSILETYKAPIGESYDAKQRWTFGEFVALAALPDV